MLADAAVGVAKVDEAGGLAEGVAEGLPEAEALLLAVDCFWIVPRCAVHVAQAPQAVGLAGHAERARASCPASSAGRAGAADAAWPTAASRLPCSSSVQARACASSQSGCPSRVHRGSAVASLWSPGLSSCRLRQAVAV